ncbi:LysR family transcriptional regulator [Achromobacter sp. UMC71]|uniref:LysR family transcriptional regulator n=1 Tax=Achromobacter sp. UMC71 TaxID=1862320 RepID=UPI001600E279|nr:LysR family transcriptional regulator [Achromobacter sp. UMC71]MBB1624397.1 LysR family transcriptional regulator [Achromobacter sp. UMC71]
MAHSLLESQDVFRRLRLKSQQVMLLDALEKHGNLHRAAKAIHVTQPAATNLLRQLEDGLGVLLFVRHARGLSPTAFGETMIRYARGILHNFDHAREEMAAFAEGATGLVRMGSVSGAVPSLLVPAVARCKLAFPRLRISLLVDTSDLLLPMLLRDDLDVVLGRLPDHFVDEDLDVQLLGGEPMSIVARPGHPLATKRRLALSHLRDCAWVLHPTGSPMRRRVDQALMDAGLVHAPDVVESASILVVTALLEKSDMVSVLPSAVAQHYARFRMLKILPVALPLSMPPLGIITRKRNSHSPALKNVLELLCRETVLAPA